MSSGDGGAGGVEGSVGQTADGEHAAAIGQTGQEVGLTAPPSPFLEDGGVALYQGDAVAVLRQLPAGLAQTCITSPPYWGLRDYGEAGQLGLEASPELFVERLVEVFREVRRVLRPDGTVWLNLGDSYAADHAQQRTRQENYGIQQGIPGSRHRDSLGTPEGLKAKDLVGIPWMVAFALRADGWYLRSDVIWAKRNGMPESVRDRPSVAHEHIFLLAKRPNYFYDWYAIREPHAPDGRKVTGRTSSSGSHDNHRLDAGERRERWPGDGRNRRSVWSVATESFPDAHFATFPRKLIRPMVLAGSSARGQCRVCGAPWRRAVETTYEAHGGSARSGGEFAGDREHGDLEHGRFRPQEMRHGRATRVDTTTGWEPTCGHGDRGIEPQVVLDPFIGSGTTAAVAREEGRRCVGIDLKAEYLAMAGRRSQQLSLLEAWQ